MTLIGHQLRWQALQRAFAKNQIPQTLLLSGPPHVGKTALFQAYAQLLVCAHVQNDELGLPAPCGKCRACHQIELGVFPDFRVYRPLTTSSKEGVTAPEALDSSIIPIDVAREFCAEALKKPVNATGRKVMAIFQADRLQIAAQNALLKTLEEPVAGLHLVLVTDRPAHLLPTIFSRCWHLPLSLVSDRVLSDWLAELRPGTKAAERAQMLVAARGRPGALRREIARLEGQENHNSEARAVQVDRLLNFLEGAHPVAMFKLSADAQEIAQQWGVEDEAAGLEAFAHSEAQLKKAERIMVRSNLARFLDELVYGCTRRMDERIQDEAWRALWAARLDQIRKTRHYILRNANANLALDVMFGRLIALRPPLMGKH